MSDRCADSACVCHTNPAQRVLTPFPDGGPRYCCTRCARSGADWADAMAREWTEETLHYEMKLGSAGFIHDLAVLLREVECHNCTEHQLRTEKSLLAEVRRVVEDVQAKARKDWGGGGDRWAEVKLYTDEILARLEKL